MFQSQYKVVKVGMFLVATPTKIDGWVIPPGKRAKEGKWNEVDRRDQQQKRANESDAFLGNMQKKTMKEESYQEISEHASRT